MQARPEVERWIQDGEGQADTDPTVSSDAMRWRPEPPPSIRLPHLMGLNPATPRPTGDQLECSLDRAGALWAEVGDGYRHLAGA